MADDFSINLSQEKNNYSLNQSHCACSFIRGMCNTPQIWNQGSQNLFCTGVMGIVTNVLCNRNKASLEEEDELKVY